MSRIVIHKGDTKRKKRRDQVLEAAAACFGVRGFQATSIAEISAAANMSPGHIYHYFKNKQAIVEAIVFRDLGRALAAVMVSTPHGGTLPERFLCPDKAAPPTGGPDLTIEILAEATRNAAVTKIVTNCRASLAAELRKSLEIGCAPQDIGDGRSLNAICTVLTVIRDGIMVNRAVDPSFRADVLGSVVPWLIQRLLGQSQSLQPFVQDAPLEARPPL